MTELDKRLQQFVKRKRKKWWYSLQKSSWAVAQPFLSVRIRFNDWNKCRDIYALGPIIYSTIISQLRALLV